MDLRRAGGCDPWYAAAMSWLPLLVLGALAQDAPVEAPPSSPDPAPGEPPAPPPPLTPPALLEAAPPVYPPGLDLGRVDVELLLLIDEHGAVEQVGLVSGPEPFASLAVAAAAALRFTPAREGDLAVAVEAPFTYTFPEPPVSLRLTVALPDGRPAAGASVVVGDATHALDAQGALILRNLSAGDRQVLLQLPGYTHPPVLAPVREGEQVEIAMVARPVPAEAGLLAEYRRVSGASVERRLSSAEVAATPGTLGDAVRAIANLPGVVRTPLDAGWLLVRGGDPEDTGLFVDGVRVPLVYHLGGFTSVVHPAMVDEVVYLPGGMPARYGRATAGVVDLVTRRPGATARVEAGADLVASGVYAEAPIRGGWGAQLSARRSYLDAILGLLPGISEEQSQIAPRFWDWSARLDGPTAGVFALGFDDQIDVPGDDEGEVLTIASGTARIMGRIEPTIADRTLRVLPVVARNWLDIQSASTSDRRVYTTGGLRLELPDPRTGPLGLSGGIEAELGRYDMEVESFDVGGLYGSVDPYVALRVDGAVEQVLGARLETLWVEQQQLRARPSLRWSGRAPVSSSLTLRADAGLLYQPPPVDAVLGYPAGPYLHLERARGGGLGASWGGAPMSVELDAWGRRLDHLTVVEDDATLGEGDGVAWGVEAMVRGQAGPVSGWLSYGWSRSLRREEPGDLLEPYTYDQPHSLVLVAAWALGHDWTLAGRWRYGSGYPRDDDQDTATDLLTQTDVSLDPWPERLPPFHSLDLKISRRVLSRGLSLDGYLDVQNVYNRRVPEPAISGLQFQSPLYTYGLPVLPIFGLQGRWRAPGTGS